MARYLGQHRDLCVSWPKEPHYMASDMRGLSVVDSDEDYRALFHKPGARIRMDASVWYLYSDDAIRNILARRPDARFIVMLRNPVAMIPSLHRQLVNALEEDVTDLGTAWSLSGDRAAGRAVPAGCRAPKTLIYTRTAALGAQLARLLEQVEPDRVLPLFQEELRADPRSTYRRSLEFLGIADDGRSSFEIVNEARGFRLRPVQALVKRDVPLLQTIGRPIKRTLGLRSLGFRQVLSTLNDAPVRSASVPPALAAAIGEFYRDDMQLLADLLGRDLAAEFGWPLQSDLVA
jgi:hypothetical protein